MFSQLVHPNGVLSKLNAHYNIMVMRLSPTRRQVQGKATVAEYTSKQTWFNNVQQ
jgi:hypothetical protein